MSTKLSVRLSDDVLQAVDEAARQQERNRSQVINRALRAALDINQNENWKGISGVVPAEVRIIKRPTEPPTETYTAREPEKNLEKPKRQSGMCGHGREVKFCVQCQVTAKKGLNG